MHSHDRSAWYELTRTCVLHQRAVSACSASGRSRRSRHLARAIAQRRRLHIAGGERDDAGAGISRPRARTGAGGRLAARPVPRRPVRRRDWSAAVAAGRRLMRVLVVVHGFPPLAQGGTRDSTVTRTRRGCATHYGDDVAGPDARARSRRARVSRSRRAARRPARRAGSTTPFARRDRSRRPTTTPPIAALAADFIDEFRPDVAHVHHLTCLSTGIVCDAEAPRRADCLHAARLLAALPSRPAARSAPAALRRAARARMRLRAPASPGTRDLRRTPALGSSGRSRRNCRRPFGNRCGAAQRRWRRDCRPAHRRIRRSPALRHMRGVLDCVDHVLAPSRHMRDRFLPLRPGRTHRRQRIRRRARAIRATARRPADAARTPAAPWVSRQPDGVEGAASADRGVSAPACGRGDGHARRRLQRVSRRRQLSQRTSSRCFDTRRHARLGPVAIDAVPTRWRRSTCSSCRRSGKRTARSSSARRSRRRRAGRRFAHRRHPGNGRRRRSADCCSSRATPTISRGC